MAEIKPLLYKGKAIVRSGNIVYYGNPEDEYIIMMNITGSEKTKGIDITTKITVSLQTNSGTGNERVIKKVEREGLFKALDIAEYWLEDALNGEED